MSWGKDPTKWGKPITARFEPDDLRRLDALVARSRETFGKNPTRSSTILKLVRDAYATAGLPPLSAAATDDRQTTIDAMLVTPGAEAELDGLRRDVKEGLAEARRERDEKKREADLAAAEEFLTTGKRRKPKKAISSRVRRGAPRRTHGPAGRKTRAPKKQTNKQTKKAARRGGSR
jgi:hypothetical protein